MKNLTTVLILLALGWYAIVQYKSYTQELTSVPADASAVTLSNPNSANQPDNEQFKCDGRTHCSQMTSCEEAKFFIKNCPNTKMDGDNDGIPCERQWC